MKALIKCKTILRKSNTSYVETPFESEVIQTCCNELSKNVSLELSEESLSVSSKTQSFRLALSKVCGYVDEYVCDNKFVLEIKYCPFCGKELILHNEITYLLGINKKQDESEVFELTDMKTGAKSKMKIRIKNKIDWKTVTKKEFIG